MCIIFLLFDRPTWYYHAIYIVLTYSALFTGYEDDILEVISNLHIKDPILTENFTNLAENLLKYLTPRTSWSLFFPSLGPTPSTTTKI